MSVCWLVGWSVSWTVSAGWSVDLSVCHNFPKKLSRHSLAGKHACLTLSLFIFFLSFSFFLISFSFSLSRSFSLCNIFKAFSNKGNPRATLFCHIFNIAAMQYCCIYFQKCYDMTSWKKYIVKMAIENGCQTKMAAFGWFSRFFPDYLAYIYLPYFSTFPP